MCTQLFCPRVKKCVKQSRQVSCGGVSRLSMTCIFYCQIAIMCNRSGLVWSSSLLRRCSHGESQMLQLWRPPHLCLELLLLPIISLFASSSSWRELGVLWRIGYSGAVVRSSLCQQLDSCGGCNPASLLCSLWWRWEGVGLLTLLMEWICLGVVIPEDVVHSRWPQIASRLWRPTGGQHGGPDCISVLFLKVFLVKVRDLFVVSNLSCVPIVMCTHCFEY
jgi:hypothetical protein